MKDKEDLSVKSDSKSSLNKFDEKPNIIIEKDNESPDSARDYLIKNTYSRKDVSQISDWNQFNKPKFFPEESDPAKLNYNQFLGVSPHKKMNFNDGERQISNNSNLSHSFAYNNEDFAPFSNKNNMNLSRPIDMNFDTFNMLPNTSNFAWNMMNKIVDYSQNHIKQIQFNVNYWKNNAKPDNELNSVQRIDIHSLNNWINLNFSANKRITIEMIDDSQMEIRTSNKEVPVNLFFNKDDYLKESNVSKFGIETSNPMGILPSVPNEMFNSNKFGAYWSQLKSSWNKAENEISKLYK